MSLRVFQQFIKSGQFVRGCVIFVCRRPSLCSCVSDLLRHHPHDLRDRDLHDLPGNETSTWQIINIINFHSKKQYPIEKANEVIVKAKTTCPRTVLPMLGYVVVFWIQWCRYLYETHAHFKFMTSLPCWYQLIRASFDGYVYTPVRASFDD